MKNKIQKIICIVFIILLVPLFVNAEEEKIDFAETIHKRELSNNKPPKPFSTFDTPDPNEIIIEPDINSTVGPIYIAPKGYNISDIHKNKFYSSTNEFEDPDILSDSINIITEKEIDLINPNSIEELLTLVPGITVLRKGSIGSGTSFLIRGWNRNLITLDGIKINDPAFTEPFLNPLVMGGIGKIEVVKGPKAIFYGSQAQGGLIALYTRQGSGRPSIEFSGGIGNNSCFKENFTFQGSKENTDYYLGIVRLDTTGGAPTYLNESIHDDYGNLTVINNIGSKILNGKAEVRNTFTYSTGEKEHAIQAKGTPVFDPDDQNYNSLIMETASFTHQPVDYYKYNAKFAFLKTTFKDYDNDLILDYDFTKSNNNRLIFQTEHDFYVKQYDTITMGYQLEYNDFESLQINNTVLNKDITKNDVFFNNELNIKNILAIRAGSRITNFSLFGTYAVPAVSGTLKLPTFKLKNSFTKLHSSYGYSLNEPTALQQFGMFGNPNLQPEKLFGYDVGIVQSLFDSKLRMEFSYFNNKIKDLISEDINKRTFTLQNIARARISGLEASLGLSPIKSIKAEVNYNYLNARQLNEVTGNYDPIEAVPNNSWNFIVAYSPQKDYGIYFRGVSSSTRFGMDITTLEPGRTKGFFDIGFGFIAKLFEYKGFKLTLFGQTSNLTNNKYEQVMGFKHDGFRFLTGLRLNKVF